MENEQTDEVPDEDAEIRTVIARLSRPHSSGGEVIERAAILAEGARFTAILDWIAAHDGRGEVAAAKSSVGGLHGTRLNDGAGADARPPLRYVLPAGTL